MTSGSDRTGKRMQVGLFLPMRESVGYSEIRTLAVQAEELGFDSVWLMDHVFFRHDDQPMVGVWECWTMLAALAEATKRVTLGTLVLCTPFRNPALLAKMAVTLDEISNGRVILGLGAGWHEPEFEALGVPFDHRVSRFEEALQIISPLMREGSVDFRGTYYQAPNCEIRPRGPSPHGPKILVGSSGPRMLRLLARYADSWNTNWLGMPPGPFPERRAALEEACAAEGRDPATVDITVGLSVSAPHANEDEGQPKDPDRTVHGTPDEVAAALSDYEQLGVNHAILSLDRPDPTSVAWLGEAVQIFQNR